MYLRVRTFQTVSRLGQSLLSNGGNYNRFKRRESEVLIATQGTNTMRYSGGASIKFPDFLLYGRWRSSQSGYLQFAA